MGDYTITELLDIVAQRGDRIAELQTEVERLEKVIQGYLDGEIDPDNCKHGLYWYEGCTQCVDDYFAAALKEASDEENGQRIGEFK